MAKKKLDKKTKIDICKFTAKTAIGLAINKTIKDTARAYLPYSDNPYQNIAYTVGRIAVVSYVSSKIGKYVDQKIDNTVEFVDDFVEEVHRISKEKREEVAEDASNEAPATAE